MVRSGARISILIWRTSPGPRASILSGLNSTVHLSLGFLVTKPRLRIGAVPALPTTKSIGFLVPAVAQALSVPACHPLFGSRVPLTGTLPRVGASQAPTRPRLLTGDAF